MQISGAELFVKALQAEGVEHLFAYPGGTVIDIFNALHGVQDIRLILPRHEQALVHAADGYARSTGRVGVCLVTSGPGATNTVTGLATANFDSVPLVCFTGQVPLRLIGNDAFQEVDIVGMTRSVCKYTVTVTRREDLARTIKEAFYIARSGKPGPVLVDIPKDIQVALGPDLYPDSVQIRSYKPNESVHRGQLKKAVEALKKAERPVFLLGGGVNIARAQEAMTRLVEQSGVPVITTLMGKGAIPTAHPLYIGNIGLHGNYASNHAIADADLIFSIGCRFNDRITGKLSEFTENTTIVHIDIDPASISRNIGVDIPLVGDAADAIRQMLEWVPALHIGPWVQKVCQWKADYPIHMMRYSGVTAEKIITAINRRFDDCIVTTDVGQNQLWTTQYCALDAHRQLLTSGGLGTMGYGFPAAIGAQIGNPGRHVISINGDGGFQMNLQELATAALNRLPVIICVLNNGYLGNVRQWQQMFYGGRYALTCLTADAGCSPTCAGPNDACPAYLPDFIGLATSYGIPAVRVTDETDIEPAFARAAAHRDGPILIEFIIEREANVFPMVPPGEALNEMIME